jgi:hypothetical protein
MPDMTAEWIVPTALGIGLSASAGFRVFVPLLVASVAARMGLLPLSPGFGWIAGWPALVCFGSATLLEIAAYYIPFVDNLLDAFNAPMAVAAGTFLATAVMPVDEGLLKWVLGIILGGGTAGVVHAGTSLMRLLSTKMTAGVGNPVVATGEHVAAFGLSVSTLFVPVAMAVMILFLIIFFLFRRKRSAAGGRS